MTSMTVPVRLTKNDIAILSDELNSCDTGSSELADILEKILKSAHETGEKQKYIVEEINSENPFSKAKTDKIEKITRSK